MATKTVSPYLDSFAFKGDERLEYAKKSIPETLFAYGDEVVARPSATGSYLLPELEANLEAVALVHNLGTSNPGHRDIQYLFDKSRGGLTVRVVLPESVVESAVSEMLHGSRKAWSLGDFREWLTESVRETAQGSGGALAQAAQTTQSGVAEAAQAAADALREAVRPASPMEVEAKHVRTAQVAAADPSSAPLPDDASVQQLTGRLSELAGLPDGDLAQLFLGRASRERVSREHYQRWRTGRKLNATDANRRRMWFLVRLLERLADSGVGVRDWVRNTTDIDDLTPYELLRLGRFDEAEHLAANVMPAGERTETISSEGLPVLLEPGPGSFTLRSDEPTTDLVFEVDDGWVEIEGDVDDETDDD